MKVIRSPVLHILFDTPPAQTLVPNIHGFPTSWALYFCHLDGSVRSATLKASHLLV